MSLDEDSGVLKLGGASSPTLHFFSGRNSLLWLFLESGVLQIQPGASFRPILVGGETQVISSGPLFSIRTFMMRTC